MDLELTDCTNSPRSRTLLKNETGPIRPQKSCPGWWRLRLTTPTGHGIANWNGAQKGEPVEQRAVNSVH